MARDFVSNDEIIQEAYRRLSQGAWDYLVGGSESETSMRRNRHGFDRIAFRPRILVDVANVDPSTTFLGQQLRIPAILAPVGSLQEFDPDGGAAAARGATAFGTMQAVSSVTMPSLEEIATASATPKIFQLYVQGDREWTRDIVGRVKQAGYAALAITVDVARYSRRERQMVTRYAPPTRREPPDPKWRASLTWDTLDEIREMWGDGPFMLKGVMTGEDAALAVQHGVDYVWVSNHGGRQLDHTLGSAEVMPEIVQAVAGRARIILDSGVQRGSDIIKAIALGADVVALGKLQGWALAAAGAEGVTRMLEILEDEMIVSMGLMGVTKVDQITSSYICEGETVTPAHEMSAWVNKPQDRFV